MYRNIEMQTIKMLNFQRVLAMLQFTTRKKTISIIVLRTKRTHFQFRIGTLLHKMCI